MITSARDVLIDWLQNACAMEVQSTELLKSQIRRIEHYPGLRDRVLAHLTETHEQQILLGECLRTLGCQASTTKELGARLLAMGQSLFQISSHDEVIKGALISSSFERMEAAVYRAIAVAAEAAGETSIAQTCERIIAQEEAMASWLEQHLPELVKQYLVRVALPSVQAGH